MSTSENLIKIPPLCQGRTKILLQDRKWYKDKNKSSMLYTCCEYCYENYIKGTNKENDHIEIDVSGGGTNCDYLLYNTDCDFKDCSIILNNIRVSVVDVMGYRYKLIDSIDPTFSADNDSYTIIVENLTDNMLKETSMMFLEKCYINDDEFQLSNEENFTPFIMEMDVNQEGDVNNIDLLMAKYEQKSIMQMSELSDHVANGKYKAFLGMCLYECVPENVINFSFSVNKNNNDNVNLEGTFNISI